MKEENSQLRAQIADIIPNSLPSFHVSVPSDEWYDTIKERDQLRAQVDAAEAILKENCCCEEVDEDGICEYCHALSKLQKRGENEK